MVERALSGVPLNVSFRRHLIGNNLVLWHHLVTRIMHIRLMFSDGNYINTANTPFTHFTLP
jgi:hypothetical protein